MDIMLEASTTATTVVTGLDLVKKHHGDSMASSSSTSDSPTVTFSTGSSGEDTTTFSVLLANIGGDDETTATTEGRGTSRYEWGKLTGMRVRQEGDVKSARNSSHPVTLGDDGTSRNVDGSVSSATQQTATASESLLFRRGSFLDRLGVNFSKPPPRGTHTPVSSPTTAGRDDRSPSTRGNLFGFFGRRDSGHRTTFVCRRNPNQAAAKKPRTSMKEIVVDLIRCMDHPLRIEASRPPEEQGRVIAKNENGEEDRPSSFVQAIVDDFRPGKGDQKILRAVGRTAAVNAVVLVTAVSGGATAAAGFATGGVITSKRIFDGLNAEDEREVTKALAVYGAATAGSVLGQAAASAIMLGLVGAGLPAAAAVAFAVGCVSGIAAGALSEWTVDGLIDAFGEVSEWTIESVLESLARMRVRKVMDASRKATTASKVESLKAEAPKIEFV